MIRSLRAVLAALALLLPGLAGAAPPEVPKVEPPSWWPGHSIDPVRLLVRGKNLGGAEVTVAGAGLRAGRATVSAAGTHLSVDLAIDRQAAPGPRTIALRAAPARAAAAATSEGGGGGVVAGVVAAAPTAGAPGSAAAAGLPGSASKAFRRTMPATAATGTRNIQSRVFMDTILICFPR